MIGHLYPLLLVPTVAAEEGGATSEVIGGGGRRRIRFEDLDSEDGSKTSNNIAIGFILTLVASGEIDG